MGSLIGKHVEGGFDLCCNRFHHVEHRPFYVTIKLKAGVIFDVDSLEVVSQLCTGLTGIQLPIFSIFYNRIIRIV